MSDTAVVPKPHVCEICGEEFALAMHLGTHKKNKHGIAGKGGHRKKSTASPPRASPQESRKTKVKRTLLEVCDLSDDIRGREGSELPRELSAVIRRDADQLATVIAFAADRLDPIKWFVDNVLVQIVAPVIGASGILRWVFRRMRENAEAAEPEYVMPEATVDNGWRNAVAEPPEPGADSGIPQE